MTIRCHNCQNELALSSPLEIGQVLECPSCKMKYDVVWLYPPEFVPNQDQLLSTQSKLINKTKKLDGKG